jgi:putative ABC transport system permease protein
MNLVTELREGLAISWSAIRANKLRSVLTTLGIVIGIVTVTLMGTAIEGLNGSFMNSISSIGADVLYVDQRGWLIQTREDWVKALKNPAITLDDADMVQEKMTPKDPSTWMRSIFWNARSAPRWRSRPSPPMTRR